MVKNLDQLKGANIINIIERYIRLKKNGANYIACCPFHSEKSPSFVVNENKGIFKCFGCGKGGDVLAFIQEYEKIDFYQALQRLSELANIPLLLEKGEHTSPTQILDRLNSYCKGRLHSEQKLITYLQSRGISKDMLEKFDIGYMPTKAELVGHFSAKELLEANVANAYEKGQISIPMHHRITIALRNPQHKIIGFVARTHPHYDFNKNAPKYINSKESYFYKKTQTLYLYSNAKSAIQDKKHALIVEGYIDCILLHENGYKNACATGGTAFNLQHLQLLIKLDCAVCFCFDNDKSGMEANFRACKVCFNAGFYDVKVALLKNTDSSGKLCKDINEALLTGQKLKLKYLNAFSFVVRFLYKKHAKQRAFAEIKEMIARCENFYHRQSFIEEASAYTQIPAEYFTTTHTPPTTHKANARTPRDIAIFISSVIHSSECAYIASELELGFLPPKLEKALKAYLHSQQTPKELEHCVREKPLAQGEFYMLYCDLRLRALREGLKKARASRDLSLVSALSEKIAEIKRDIYAQKAF